VVVGGGGCCWCGFCLGWGVSGGVGGFGVVKKKKKKKKKYSQQFYSRSEKQSRKKKGKEGFRGQKNCVTRGCPGVSAWFFIKRKVKGGVEGSLFRSAGWTQKPSWGQQCHRPLRL